MASTIKSNIQVSPQDLLITSSTAGTDIGAYATTGDGRGFRYAKAGASALVPGTILQASAEDTTSLEALAPITAAVGATKITIATSVTVTANKLAGGFLLTTTPTAGGLGGYIYRIGGNAAALVGTSLVITLDDPLVVALTYGKTQVDLIANPYQDLVINPTTPTSSAVGVAITATPASYYGWVQTHGPSCVYAQGAVTVGNAVVPSTTTAGYIMLGTSASTAYFNQVGYALTGIATTEAGAIFLTID